MIKRRRESRHDAGPWGSEEALQAWGAMRANLRDRAASREKIGIAAL
jgi:hypothetical protein